MFSCFMDNPRFRVLRAVGSVPVICLALSLVLRPDAALGAGWSSGLQSARTTAMGNAFHAVADTPDTIFFNPAGLGLLDRKLAVQIGLHVPILLNYSAEYPYSFPDAETGATRTDNLLYESKVIPYIPHIFIGGRAGIIGYGVGWYVPMGGGQMTFADLKLDNAMRRTATKGATPKDDVPASVDNLSRYESYLAIHYLSPSVSVNLFDVVYLGWALNIHIADMKLTQQNYPKESAVQPGSFNFINNEFEGIGVAYSATVSLLLRDPFWDIFRLAFVYKMAYDIEAEGTTTLDVVTPSAKQLLGMVGVNLPQTFDSSVNFRIPHIFNIGLAAKPIDRLTLSATLDITLWNETESLTLDWHGVQIPSNVPKELFSNKAVLATGYEDVYTVEVGGEFKVMKDNLPVRLGFIYNPAAKEDNAQSVSSIDTDAYIICYGAGYTFSLPSDVDLVVDLGFYHLIGRKTDVSKEYLESAENKMDGSGVMVYSGPAGTYNKSILFGALLDITVLAL